MNTLILTLAIALAGQPPDPVVFLAAPRSPGFFQTQTVTDAIQAQFHYVQGTDLVRVLPDGTEQVLVVGHQPDGLLAVHDHCVLYDGSGVVYSHIHSQGKYCDLYRLKFADGSIEKLTDAKTEFDPPSGSAPWQLSAEKRVWNHAPVCGKDGRIAFTSSRDGVRSPRSATPANQLYVMNADGGNVENITPMELGGVAHPVLGSNGRIYYSTGQEHGYRAGGGDGWGIWSINWDGTDWQPEHSVIGGFSDTGYPNFTPHNPFHFLAFSSDRTLFAAEYYRTRVYGRILGMPQFIPTPFSEPTQFGHPFRNNNVWPRDKFNPVSGRGYSYQRRGMFSPAEWAHSQDQKNLTNGEQMGMLSHPFALRGNKLGVTWTGDEGDSAMNLGLYMQDARTPTTHPSQMTVVVDKPDRHEWLGRVVAPWVEIYGADVPTPTAPKAEDIAPGEPFGEISTSTLHIRELVDRNESLWSTPPSFHEFPTEEIEHIRILAMEPTTTFNHEINSPFPSGIVMGHNNPKGWNTSTSGGNRNFEGFNSATNERVGFFEQLIPVKKYRGPNDEIHVGPNPPAGYTRILDPSGQPDTSFRAHLPARVPWTFQLLNAKGEAIWGTTAQTWHQIIEGESRTCNGCHAHWKPATVDVRDTFAYNPLYEVPKLRQTRYVEFYEDIQPIFNRVGITTSSQPWKDYFMYGSARETVDDNPALTPEEAQAIRNWIDTGLLTNATWRANGSRITKAQMGGAWADSQRPTIAFHPTSESLLLGLFDARSGINPASLSVKSTAEIAGRAPNAELADLFTRSGDVWTMPHQPVGTLTVEVRDNQRLTNHAGQLISEDGNRTRIVRTVSDELPPPPPPPDPECEALRLCVAELEAIVASMQQDSAIKDALIAELQAKINAAKAALE